MAKEINKEKTLGSKLLKTIVKIALIIIALMTISFCSFIVTRPGPICILSTQGLSGGADPFTRPSVERVDRFTVNANSSTWLDTGVVVNNNVPFAVRATGEINLCKTSNEGIAITPRSTDPYWQSLLSTPLPANATLGIRLEGGTFCWDDDCDTSFTNGRHLYLLIDQVAPARDRHVPEENLTPRSTHTEGFFEALPPSTQPSIDGDNRQYLYYGIPGYVTNNLYARYFDWDDPDNYSDNAGGYQLRIHTSCPGNNGMYLQARIVDENADPINPAANAFSIINISNEIFNRTDNKYQANTPRSGRLQFRIADDPALSWNVRINNVYPIVLQYGDGNPANNTGSYTLEVTSISTSGTVGSFISRNIVAPVREFLITNGEGLNPSDSYVASFFTNVTQDRIFQRAVYTALVLAVILYSLAYVMGVSGRTVNDFIIFILRAGLVLQLLRPQSWEFFYDHLFILFVEGVDNLILLTTSQAYMVIHNLSEIPAINTQVNPGEFFDFMTLTINNFFNKESMLKVSSLIFLGPGPLGIIYVTVIFACMCWFVALVGRALLLYLGALIASAVLLLMMAPLFIVFVLFSRTRSIFNNWIYALAVFTAQPVLLFMIFAAFNIFFYATLMNILNFHACWGCAFELDIYLFKFCILKWYSPWGYDIGFPAATKLLKAPVNIYSVTSLFLITFLMSKTLDWIEQASGSIFSSGAASRFGASSVLSQTASTAADVAKNSMQATGDVFSAVFGGGKKKK